MIERQLFALAFVIMILAAGCAKQEKTESNDITGSSVSELKRTACTTATNANTCDSRLPQLGFVTKEECCEQFQACCD